MEKKKNFREQAPILHAMEENMFFEMAYFAKWHPEVQLFSFPDVMVMQSIIHNDVVNGVFAAHFSEHSADQRIDEVLDFFKKKSEPCAWWVSNGDLPKNLQNKLQQKGFCLKEENLGMYLFTDAFSFSNQETLWNFERVLDQEKMNDFLQVMEKIGGEKEVFQKLYKGMPEEAYGPKSCYEIHCAYMGPLPVGIGILVITSGVGGIYDLGIVPYERNRGLGTSMTEYLIKRAHEKGVSLVTLQASSCAQNLYRRLGFQECGVVRKYSL